MKLEDAFVALKAAHKTHTAAARAVGYTPRHYFEMRKDPERVSPRAAELIIVKATLLPPTPPQDAA